MTMAVNMAYVPKPESGMKVLKMNRPQCFLGGGGGASEMKYIIFKENNDNPYENYNN